MAVLSNSLYLDMTSYGTLATSTPPPTVAQAYGFNSQPATEGVNVAIVLPRANDPTALLQSDWATRQTTLATLNETNTLWTNTALIRPSTTTPSRC